MDRIEKTTDGIEEKEEYLRRGEVYRLLSSVS